ncbi:MAG: apolipoprotein N-acyltransferase [Ignavibacteriaceae bacterium]|nr:apolipoprotein N-acyltransferase [Ignavibacteriaceae bacterium]
MRLFQKKKLTAEETTKKRKDIILLSLSGLLLALAFPPFPFHYLIFVGLIPYFLVLEKRETLAEINRATYFMAFVFSLLTVYWVGGFTVGKDYYLMISGFVLLFFNPLLFLIASTLFYFALRTFSRKTAMLLFPFFWVCYEYCFSLTDFQFPWLTLGNSQSKFLHFIQLADVVGVYGLSLIILFINLFFFLSYRHYLKKSNYKIPLTIALLLVMLPIIYGVIKENSFKESGKKIRVGLVQPDLDPYEKWSGGNLNEITGKYLSLSREAVAKKAELVIWPETALPVYLLSGQYTEDLDSIRNFVNASKVSLLTGMPNFISYMKNEKVPSDAKYNQAGDFYFTNYNAILLFNPDSIRIQSYGKMKLVPFGEHTPFADQLPFLGDLIKWGVGLGGWNIGKDTTNFKLGISPPAADYELGETQSTNNQQLTTNINAVVCYESIFPELIAAFAQRGSEMIAVVTNDSWYGNTSGPYQHKEISVLRAVENRRSVVRAANGGISCIVNPLGVTVAETKMYTKDVLVGNVSLNSEKTFYTRHPFLVPVTSSVLSLWIFGIFILFKLKAKFKGSGN